MQIQKHGLELYVLLDGSKKQMLNFVEQSLAWKSSCSDFSWIMNICIKAVTLAGGAAED